MAELKQKIYESVSPFVKKVLEIKPCIHRGVTDDDFFAGKFDGNWRLKVIPKLRYYIPNFIVIGEDVMAKAVYTKRLGDKEDMCTECYRPGHYRKDCKGSRNWLEYCAEFKDMWDQLMAQVYESEESEELVHEEDSRLLKKLTESERERRKVIKDSEKETLELKSQLKIQSEGLEEMKKQKEYVEKQVKVLSDNLEEAQKKAEKAVTELQKNLYFQRVDVDVQEEVYRRDARIEELEKENHDIVKEMEGLKKLTSVVEKTMQENISLKDRVKLMETQNEEVMDRLRKFEDSMKVTSRRLSKSQEDVVDLNDTVSTEMFKEHSSNSPPFHGFATASEEEREVEVSNVKNKVKQKGILKRVHSNPEVVLEVPKRKNRHPKIGSNIILDTASESGVYQVLTKRHPSDSDYMYSLGKDGKTVTLNLKRVNWEFFDAGEKVALKGTT